MTNQTTITRVRRPGIDWASAERYAAEHGIELVDSEDQEPAWYGRDAFWLTPCQRHYAGNATARMSGRE